MAKKLSINTSTGEVTQQDAAEKVEGDMVITEILSLITSFLGIAKTVTSKKEGEKLDLKDILSALSSIVSDKAVTSVVDTSAVSSQATDLLKSILAATGITTTTTTTSGEAASTVVESIVDALGFNKTISDAINGLTVKLTELVAGQAASLQSVVTTLNQAQLLLTQLVARVAIIENLLKITDPFKTVTTTTTETK